MDSYLKTIGMDFVELETLPPLYLKTLNILTRQLDEMLDGDSRYSKVAQRWLEGGSSINSVEDFIGSYKDLLEISNELVPEDELFISIIEGILMCLEKIQ